MTNVRVRYAPSPTGAPHIGNIRTALFDYLFARHNNGTFVLRIEDTDKKRETQTGIQEQLDALAWLGLDYDEGYGKGGKYGPYLQSERLPIYHKYIEQMIAEGKAYRAFDTPDELTKMREDQQRRGLPPGYNRRHRYLTDEERAKYEIERAEFATVRFAVPLEGKTSFTDAVYGEITVENRLLEDAVLLKSDGFPTYHFAATLDDHLMEITHVLRGEEWIPSAPMHILIHKALGWDPPMFVHLPVMMGPDKKKFGKRNGAKEMLEYRSEGYLPEAMINFLALQGWSPKEERDLFSREELIEKFNINGLLNRSPISDAAKLDWYNGQYIRALPLLDLAARVLPFLQAEGLVGENPDDEMLEYIGNVMMLEQERIKTLKDAPALADFFLMPDFAYIYDEKAVQKWFGHPGIGERLKYVRAAIADLDEFTPETAEAAVRATIDHFGVKGGEVIHPVRVAVSGRTTGPGLFEMMAVLGKDRVLRRLDRTIGLVTA